MENANIYQMIFEFCSTPIAVFRKDCVIALTNKAFAELAGFNREEIEGKKEWTEFIRAEDIASFGKDGWDGSAGDGVPVYHQFEVPFYSGDGTVKAVLANIVFLRGEATGLAILVDITARKQAEEALRSAHRQLQDILEFLPDPTFVIDKQKRVIAWNQAIEALTGIPKEQMIGEGDYAYAKPFFGRRRQVLIDHLGDNPQVNQAGYEKYTRSGETVCGQVFAPKLRQGRGGFVWGIAAPLYNHKGELVGAIETLRDITEQKLQEEQLKYLSLHDAYLDIYNRAYFEQEMRRVEKGRYNAVGIIICDVDGLKMVNDTLGHNAGDAVLRAAARVIKKAFRENDMVARVGGDEFVAILPECDEEKVEQVCNRLKAAIREHNNQNPEIPLSISTGFAAGRPPFQMVELLKQADQNMYRNKLHRKQRLQGTVPACLLKALEKRDHRAKSHAQRVRNLVAALGTSMGLPKSRLADLCLFGRFHDIGKIGIPGSILHKPGPLAAEEWSLMQRHCEIGHSIALAAPELAPVADLILKHHEWWNGEGYPFGLKGEAIPLECRILAISDAYEAMTSDRPYRKAIPVQEALSELWRCTESQFDPELVPQFIRVVEEQR